MLFVVGIVLATVFAVQLLDQMQSILMETAVTMDVVLGRRSTTGYELCLIRRLLLDLITIT